MTMHNIIKKGLRPISIAALATAVTLTSACSLFSVYTIDLPQGTPISYTQAEKVQVGMSTNQVLNILGSPAMHDTLAPNRWDYVYDYKAGTVGKREGKMDISNASQHLAIYFDTNGRVNNIQGLASLKP